VSKIQVSARMKIRPGELEEFERQAAECIMQVKEKDLGTLHYDWFPSND
jgi:quinol monooxygenase YgiN